MIDTYRKLMDLLDARERRNAILLFFLIVGLGVAEVVGVVSLIPFIAVVANPDIVETNRYLAAISDFLGFTDSRGFLVFLGFFTFVVLVVRLTYTALARWAMARYSFMRAYTLSSRLLQGYLDRPYTFFLNQHSSRLSTAVLSEVNLVVGKSLMPALELTAHGVTALFLISLVIVVDTYIAMVSVLVVGGAYSAIYLLLKGYITRLGSERVKNNRARFHVAQEAFGGIKDVKVLGLEDGYIREFSQPAKRYARVQAKSQIISELPQLGMRALVFGGMLILVIALLLSNDGDLGRVLPMIVLYAYAGSRLIPALQKVYKSSITLRFGKTALDLLHKDLVETGQVVTQVDSRTPRQAPEPILLNETLALEKVCFTYPDAESPALDDVDICIPAKTTVGIVGSTGAGKTTLVDLVLGLLEPQKGRLLVDGRAIRIEESRAWQRNIGYVPQSIFLCDNSVAANIAFGMPADKIDMRAVERAARIAELHEFVTTELPQGYDTMVGERGVRLSGGQRQRIGIARALYHDPGVLLLDEATSALDNVTERAVMDAVQNLAHRKTIIMIAHRLSTVRQCDEIFLLDRGRLLNRGTYAELVDQTPRFRAMAGLSAD